MRWTLLFTVFLTTCVFGASENAEKSQDSDLAAVEEKIKDTVPALLKALRHEGMSPVQKSEKILSILSPICHFKLMAFRALGREYWAQLTNEQREEFVDLFVKHLLMQYIGKAERFADKEMHYGEPEWKEGSEHRKILMNTYVYINQKNTIQYKFTKLREGDDWRLYGMEIAGIEPIITSRNQYQHKLDGGSVQDLFDHMRSIVETEK